MMREKVSRPSSSVPIQCAPFGARRRRAFCSEAEYGAMSGAKMARMTVKAMMTAPMMPIGLRHLRRMPRRERPDSAIGDGATVVLVLVLVLILSESAGQCRRTTHPPPG